MTISELKSKFSNIEKLKVGGQKTVYKVKAVNGKIFALKFITNASDPRVLQEIDIVSKLNIENVPRIIESGLVYDEQIDENILYIIEEYIGGVSLRDWLQAGNKADLSMAHKILSTLLDVEVTLEKSNILHRDINPNNIIVGTDEKIYLIDFGLAKNLIGNSLTRTTSPHGPFTPGYAPHEQFNNNKLAQDVRTDLFQIGVTVYEACSGSNPFRENGDSVYEIMTKTMTVVPNALIINGDTKGMFTQLISMLMAKNQSQRPNTALDAQRYLKAIENSLTLEE